MTSGHDWDEQDWGLRLIAAFERFGYPGLGTRMRCHCLLEVFRDPAGGLLVVATERADNPGSSVSNASERLWHLVDERLGDWGGPLRRYERWVETDGTVLIGEVVVGPGGNELRAVEDEVLAAVLRRVAGRSYAVLSRAADQPG